MVSETSWTHSETHNETRMKMSPIGCGSSAVTSYATGSQMWNAASVVSTQRSRRRLLLIASALPRSRVVYRLSDKRSFLLRRGPVLQAQAFDPRKFTRVVCSQSGSTAQHCARDQKVQRANHDSTPLQLNPYSRRFTRGSAVERYLFYALEHPGENSPSSRAGEPEGSVFQFISDHARNRCFGRH